MTSQNPSRRGYLLYRSDWTCLASFRQNSMMKLRFDKTKTSYLIPQQHPGILAPPGWRCGFQRRSYACDGMDSSSEKNDVVRHDVSRRIPVVCWEARPFAASKSFPSSSVQLLLPDNVVNAVHQRPAPCKHRQEDDIIPSQTRRGGERSDEQELAHEELFETAIVSSRAHPPSS